MDAPTRVPAPSRATEIARLELARLAPEMPLDQVFRRACELTAEAVAVERVGIWLFIDDRKALRCANLYERSKQEHSAGAVLRVADFPTYFSSLALRKAVPAEVAATEAWTAELAASYLGPLGISSTLDAGIFVDGTLVGVVCQEHVGPAREWTTEVRDLAGNIADLLALRLQSAQARELRAAFQTQRDRLAAQAAGVALEQLAAGVAHDFKNLLMAVLSYGQLLRDEPSLPPALKPMCAAILEAAERGSDLAQELTEFARHGERAPAVLDLGAVTAGLVPMLQAAVGSRHPLRFVRPRALGQVLIDKTHYARLLLNLVVNARDAMPQGGAITLRLAPVKLADHPSHSGRFVLLEVVDDGAGIDEATKRRIFEPFFTTKNKGSGLGLAIVRSVVDRAGGLIRIDSAPCRGTTFRVFFPRIGASSGESALYPLPPELQDLAKKAAGLDAPPAHPPLPQDL